jgi:hypothetical protein
MRTVDEKGKRGKEAKSVRRRQRETNVQRTRPETKEPSESTLQAEVLDHSTGFAPVAGSDVLAVGSSTDVEDDTEDDEADDGDDLDDGEPELGLWELGKERARVSVELGKCEKAGKRWTKGLRGGRRRSVCRSLARRDDHDEPKLMAQATTRVTAIQTPGLVDWSQ